MGQTAVARSDGGLFRGRGSLLALLFAVTSVLLASCGAEEGKQGGENDGGKAEAGEKAGQKGPEAGVTRPAERVTVEELSSNPSEFYGDTVTVSGKVIEAVEPGAFRIENDGTRLLVVGVEQISKIVNGDTKAVNEGDRIRATGKVRQFEKEEIRKKVDYGIDNEYFGDYEGDPAVLAYSVKVIA